jgi:hypothetical protein
MFNVIRFALFPHIVMLRYDTDDVAILKDMNQMLYSREF